MNQATILRKVQAKSGLIETVLLRQRERHKAGQIGGSYGEAAGLQRLKAERMELQKRLNPLRLVVNNENEKEA